MSRSRFTGQSFFARHSTSARRAAKALVIPAALAATILGGSPAQAATTAPGTSNGICNGVVNQLAHRGSVQENLLKAAAKKNADLIASLSAQRTALESQRAGLQAQLDQANQQLADLEAQQVKLGADEKAAQANLDAITAQQATVAAQVAEGQKMLDALRGQAADL